MLCDFVVHNVFEIWQRTYVNAQVKITNSGKRTATLDHILYWQFQFGGPRILTQSLGRT